MAPSINPGHDRGGSAGREQRARGGQHEQGFAIRHAPRLPVQQGRADLAGLAGLADLGGRAVVIGASNWLIPADLRGFNGRINHS